MPTELNFTLALRQHCQIQERKTTKSPQKTQKTSQMHQKMQKNIALLILPFPPSRPQPSFRCIILFSLHALLARGVRGTHRNPSIMQKNHFPDGKTQFLNMTEYRIQASPNPNPNLNRFGQNRIFSESKSESESESSSSNCYY